MSRDLVPRSPFSVLRGGALALALMAAAGRADAQHFALERSGSTDSVLVGEVVTLRARVHIGPQQNLASPVPALVGELPDGVRLLGADTLRPDGKRTVLAGDVRVAFYRPGRFQVPPLRLILRPIASDRGQPLEPEPVWVDVGTTLPPGNPSLRDIRDDLPRPPVNPVTWLAVLFVGAGLLFAARYWGRRLSLSAGSTVSGPGAGLATPLDQARAELDRLAAEPWTDAGDYYERVADVLRQYFIAVAPGVRDSQTSRELLAVLAAQNGNGAWTGTERVLGAADLVKFAGRMPAQDTAHAWAADVRSLLSAWDTVLAPAAPARRPPSSVSRQ
jgi:hypothetical protein